MMTRAQSPWLIAAAAFMILVGLVARDAFAGCTECAVDTALPDCNALYGCSDCTLTPACCRVCSPGGANVNFAVVCPDAMLLECRLVWRQDCGYIVVGSCTGGSPNVCVFTDPPSQTPCGGRWHCVNLSCV